jgi:hypothetical protein
MTEAERAITTLIEECAEKYKNREILNTPFTCNDRGSTENTYTFCYDKRIPSLRHFAGPDYSFHSWASVNIHSFEAVVRQIKVASKKPPTINKIGWFGNLNSALSDVPEYSTRHLLYLIGQQHKDLFDIVHVYPRPGGIIDEQVTTYKSLPDLVSYKYLIDIGGNGWSARLKFLLFSKRPLLLIDRHYVDYWYEDLIPYVHYVPVHMDLSNLLEQTYWMMENYEECLKMAEAAYQYAVANFTHDKILERVHRVHYLCKMAM